MQNYPCSPEINLTWSFYIILKILFLKKLLCLVCQYLVDDFCIYSHNEYWSSLLLFLVMSLVLVSNKQPHRMSWAMFYCILFFRGVCETGIDSSLNVQWNSPVKHCGSGVFFVGSFKMTNLTYLLQAYSDFFLFLNQFQ